MKCPVKMVGQLKHKLHTEWSSPQSSGAERLTRSCQNHTILHSVSQGMSLSPSLTDCQSAATAVLWGGWWLQGHRGRGWGAEMLAPKILLEKTPCLLKVFESVVLANRTLCSISGIWLLGSWNFIGWWRKMRRLFAMSCLHQGHPLSCCTHFSPRPHS